MGQLIKKSYLDYFSIAVILAVLLYFYYCFFLYTANIPVNDDYNAVLEFLNNFKATTSFSERLSLIFAQHNEHRIVYDRIWILINYKLSGGMVNFNFLAFIGNLSYFFIFILMAIPFWKKGLIYVIPIAVLLFNFAFHENMTFPMATLSNNTGVLFALLSLYFAATDRRFAYLGIVFYVMAVCTVGAGLFLTPLLPIIFWHTKQKKLLWIFIAVMIVTLVLYFAAYQKPPQNAELMETLANFKMKTALFFFSFAGSVFSYYLIFTNNLTDSQMIAAMVGVLTFLFYIYLAYKKYYKTHLFLFAVLTFVMLAAILTSVSRTQFGLETAIASRYRLYSAIFFIGCYYYYVNDLKWNDNLKYSLVLLFSGFYFINVSLPQEEYLDYRQSQNYLGAINYASGNHKLLNGFEQDFYKKVLEKAAFNKTYFMPDAKELNGFYPFSKQLPTLTQNNNTDKWFTQGVEQVYELNDSFLIFGKAFLDGESTYSQSVCLELEDTATKQTKTFETSRVKRYDMNPYFKKSNLDYGGFCCRVKKNLLGSREYAVKLAIKNKDLFKKELTDIKLKKTY